MFVLTTILHLTTAVNVSMVIDHPVGIRAGLTIVPFMRRRYHGPPRARGHLLNFFEYKTYRLLDVLPDCTSFKKHRAFL